MSEFTVMLAAVEAGQPRAAEEFLKLVYGELRALAAAKMARQPPGHTLQPTALVHEAWMKLVGSDRTTFENRAHFFGAAADAMRHILIDHARRKLARRHGGGMEKVNVDDFELASPVTDQQLLDLNEALDHFGLDYPVQAKVVKLRFFAGMTHEEISGLLGISVSTVKNYWTFSRAWLFQRMGEE